MDGHLIAAIGTLATALALLWKLDRGRMLDDLKAARREAEEYRDKWAAEVKERAKESEIFLRALEHARARSSRPPPT